jgi:hypothetical protein
MVVGPPILQRRKKEAVLWIRKFFFFLRIRIWIQILIVYEKYIRVYLLFPQGAQKILLPYLNCRSSELRKKQFFLNLSFVQLCICLLKTELDFDSDPDGQYWKEDRLTGQAGAQISLHNILPIRPPCEQTDPLQGKLGNGLKVTIFFKVTEVKYRNHF